MFNTKAYRLAPSGEGEHAFTWNDKPHRLIYDLCGEVERLQAIDDVIPNPDTTWAMAELISDWADDIDFATTTVDDCDLASRLEEMLVDKIVAAEAAKGDVT